MHVLRAGASLKADASNFTGDVYIDSIADSQGPTRVNLKSVHFTPCARTGWHVHSIGQTIWVVEGEGRIQARGGPVRRIQAGDIVVTPGGEWHWHGAAPDTFMTHITFTEGVATFGDLVTDDEYFVDPS